MGLENLLCWILAWSSLTHQCDLRDQGAERVHMLAYPRELVYIMLKCFLFVECAALGKAITGFTQEVRCFLPALFDLLFAHLADSIHFPMSSKYHDLCDAVDFLDWNHNACIRWKTVSYKDPGIVVTTNMHSHFATGRSLLACCVYIASLPCTCIHIKKYGHKLKAHSPSFGMLEASAALILFDFAGREPKADRRFILT